MPTSLPPPASEDIELRQLFRRLRPSAPWIAVATALAMAGAYLSAAGQPRVYESSASLMSASGGSSGSSAVDLTVSAPPLTPDTVTQVLHSPLVVADIVQRLRVAPLPAPVRQELSDSLRDELRTQRFQQLVVRARVDNQERGVYEVVARAGSAPAAKALAGASARALLAWDTRRARARYTRARKSLEAQLAARQTQTTTPGGSRALTQTLGNIWQLRLLESAASGTLTLVAQPVTPSRPVAPRPSRDAALAGLLALLSGSGVALLLHSLRRRVRGAADIEPLGLMVLGELPLLASPERQKSPGLVAACRREPLLDALGYLRLRLLPLLAQAPEAAVVVCGAHSDQGSSGVVAALAAHLGASGLKVLIIDAQLEHSRQRQLWPVYIAPWHPLPGAQLNLADGVATTLAQACLNPQVAQVARVSSQVDVLPADESGPETSLRLSSLHQANFPELLRRWSAAYDVVLIDAPPMLALPDALAAAPGTAGLLLVADVSRARVGELEDALSLAYASAVPVLGCVLTRPGHLPEPAPERAEAQTGRPPVPARSSAGRSVRSGRHTGRA